MTPATEVHHIIALRDGGRNEEGNLRSLCKTCHSKRTARGE
ncbi:MAG: HNH endonuclease [Caldilineaceae bacterium]|nr:HNH endonuclease [Caldilineaceae bacterium]